MSSESTVIQQQPRGTTQSTDLLSIPSGARRSADSSSLCFRWLELLRGFIPGIQGADQTNVMQHPLPQRQSHHGTVSDQTSHDPSSTPPLVVGFEEQPRCSVGADVQSNPESNAAGSPEMPHKKRNWLSSSFHRLTGGDDRETIEQLKAEKSRLNFLLTKELRAHEKDINLPDKDALATEFVHAFNIKKEAGKPLTKEEKELLCSIFQKTFDYNRTKLQRMLHHYIDVMLGLSTGELVQPSSAFFVEGAYLRLLEVLKSETEDPTTSIICDESDLLEALKALNIQLDTLPPGVSVDFIKSANRVSQHMLLSVPPFISSCDAETFEESLHDDYDGVDIEGSKIIYERPILYSDCKSKVVLKAKTRVVGDKVKSSELPQSEKNIKTVLKAKTCGYGNEVKSTEFPRSKGRHKAVLRAEMHGVQDEVKSTELSQMKEAVLKAKMPKVENEMKSTLPPQSEEKPRDDGPTLRAVLEVTASIWDHDSLGLHLKIPHAFLDYLYKQVDKDEKKKKELIIKEWLKDKPTWNDLYCSLHDMNEVEAEKILKEKYKDFIFEEQPTCN